MSVRCFVQTTPISRASATARSLSDGFEPPASRIRSARSRSRLRTLIEGSGVAWRGIGSTKFAVSFSPGSQPIQSLSQVVLPLSAGTSLLDNRLAPERAIAHAAASTERGSRVMVGEGDTRGPPQIAAPGNGSANSPRSLRRLEYRVNGSPVREAIDVLKPRIPDAKAWDLSRGLCPGRLRFCRCLISLVGRILSRVLADAGLPSAPASLCISQWLIATI